MAEVAIRYCVNQVQKQVARTDKGELLLNYFSQADVTQKVVGPLRRNQLTSAQADEIRALTEDKRYAFFELVTKTDKKMKSDLLVVLRDGCKIEKTYVLLDGR